MFIDTGKKSNAIHEIPITKIVDKEKLVKLKPKKRKGRWCASLSEAVVGFSQVSLPNIYDT